MLPKCRQGMTDRNGPELFFVRTPLVANRWRNWSNTQNALRASPMPRYRQHFRHIATPNAVGLPGSNQDFQEGKQKRVRKGPFSCLARAVQEAQVPRRPGMAESGPGRIDSHRLEPILGPSARCRLWRQRPKRSAFCRTERFEPRLPEQKNK